MNCCLGTPKLIGIIFCQKALSILKIFSIFATQKNVKMEILMNFLSSHVFFFYFLGIPNLDAKIVVLPEGARGGANC